MQRFDGQKLEVALRAHLAQLDVDPVSIDHVVTSMVETSLRGVDSHGINLFPHYHRAFVSGRIAKRPRLEIVERGPSTAVLDAGDAIGHHAGAVAMDLALELAASAGMGAVAVRNSTHFGAAAYFGLRAPRRDCLGFAFTNADALVQAWGAKEPFFGTNPICFTAPMQGEDPLCLDMATSLVSWNKVRNRQRDGLPLPDGWASDALGHPTLDSHAARMLAPIGGYKGFGLGFMVEVLCGFLSDGPVATELLPMFTTPIEVRRQISHFFAAIRIDRFLDPERFAARLTSIAHRLRTLEPIGEAVQVPGDPEKLTYARRVHEGIPIHTVILSEFLDIEPRFSEALLP